MSHTTYVGGSPLATSRSGSVSVLAGAAHYSASPLRGTRRTDSGSVTLPAGSCTSGSNAGSRLLRVIAVDSVDTPVSASRFSSRFPSPPSTRHVDYARAGKDDYLSPCHAFNGYGRHHAQVPESQVTACLPGEAEVWPAPPRRYVSLPSRPLVASSATASAAPHGGSRSSTAAPDEGSSVGSRPIRLAMPRAASRDVHDVTPKSDRGDSRSSSSTPLRRVQAAEASPHSSRGRTLEDTLQSDIRGLLASVLGNPPRRQEVKPSPKREPLSLRAILNSYQLLKGLHQRRYRRIAECAGPDDLLVGVLCKLHDEFKGPQGTRDVRRGKDGGGEPGGELAAKPSSLGHGTEPEGNDPSKPKEPEAQGFSFSSWLFGSANSKEPAGSSAAAAVDAAVGAAVSDPLWESSPWEGCEELADEDLVDFLAEWATGGTGGAAPVAAAENMSASVGVAARKALWQDRWQANCIDASCGRDTITASTDAGTISTRSSISCGASESNLSLASSAWTSDELGGWQGPPDRPRISSASSLGSVSSSMGLPLTGPLDPCAEEPTDDADMESGWEREFAEQVRQSMQ